MTNFDNRDRALRGAGIFAVVILVHALVAYVLATAAGSVPPQTILPPLEATIVADTPMAGEAEPPPPALPDLAPPPDVPMPEIAVDAPPPSPPDQTPAPEQQPEKPPEKPPVVPPKPEKPKTEPVKPEKPAKPHTAPSHPASAKSGPVAAAPTIDRSQSCPPPQYPREAEDAGATGVTHLQFVIDADGHVAESRIIKSSGHASLDQAALRALSRCKFNPGMANGQRQRASLSLTYRWQLDN
jgi:protein TonB